MTKSKNNNSLKHLQNDLRIAMGQMMKHGEERDKAIIMINAILDSIDHELIITDNKGKIKYLNKKSKTHLFTKIKKHEHDNTIKGLFLFLIKNYKISNEEKLMDLVYKTFENESFVCQTLKISLIHTTEKNYEIITSPIYEENIGHLGRIWQFRDITMQEKIDQMKSEFLSIASHQLRTPLTSIKGYTDMILSKDFGDFGENLQEPLQAIAKASNQMSELLDDLLNISRIETGKYSQIKLEKIHLYKFIIKEIKEVKIQANNKNINIKLNFKLKKNFHLISDKTRLSESITNLLNNAIKYSPQNTIITINIFIDNLNNLQIDIIDQGIGIPKDQQDRIFEKFFRAANVLQENFDGTGLGLFYVKKAINDLEGQINFESEKNKGTKFTIKLPITH